MSKFDTSLKDIKLKDLVFVILYGVVISILLGIALGFLDNFIRSFTNFSFSILMFFFSAQYIGNTVRKQYIKPHIVYTVITGIFLVLQAVIIYGLPLVYTLAQALGDITIVFNLGMYLQYALLLITSIFTSFDFNYILMLLIIAVGTYVGVSKTY
ncbi:MAG: hypothetical protein JEZ05_01715 [Tenericutes bacterium]|nr:hypothetical protein [Mycoplasmatota bacterium]